MAITVFEYPDPLVWWHVALYYLARVILEGLLASEGSWVPGLWNPGSQIQDPPHYIYLYNVYVRDFGHRRTPGAPFGCHVPPAWPSAPALPSAPGLLGLWTPVFQGSWALGLLDSWSPGPPDSWFPGLLGPWAPGFLGSWSSGLLVSLAPGVPELLAPPNP